ncbi:MAG: hypothetical protein ABSF77_14470 [Spirochaetia bacterium]|jgi:hypothetical protein
MSKTASRIIGIIAIVLSLASAGYGAYWFSIGRTKHGLLFAVIFVILLLFGLISVRAKGKPAEQQPK